MGTIFDCFRGSTNEQNPQPSNILTPDTVILLKDILIIFRKLVYSF